MSIAIRGHAAASQTGRARAENQDAHVADPAAGLFLVADGMGGKAAGGVASRAVAEVLPRLLAGKLAGVKDAPRTVSAALVDALADFSASLRDRLAGDPRLSGLGAALVLALVRGGFVCVANAGDCRAYLLERGRLKRLTADHSLAVALADSGGLAPELAARHPLRNQLSRFIGQEGRAAADAHIVRVKAAGRLLLCSDGLWGALGDARLAAALSEEDAPEAACRRLLAEAAAAGGTDDATAVVVDLSGGGGRDAR